MPHTQLQLRARTYTHTHTPTLRRTPKLQTELEPERIFGVELSDELQEGLKIFAGSGNRGRRISSFLEAHEEDASILVGAIAKLLQLGRHLDDEVGEETVDHALEEFVACAKGRNKLCDHYS